jgi:hypothetical protein
MPTEGIFENCNVDTTMATCLQRLQVMHDGGIQVVVFPAQDGSPANLAAYDQAAHQLGMSVMWALSNQGWWLNQEVQTYYPGFAAACGCSDNASLLSYMVHFFASLPATYGYYAADDSVLPNSDQAAIASYVAQIKAADPVGQVMIASADQSQASQYQHIGDLNGAEIYPVSTDSLLPIGANQGTWDGVGATAAQAQQAADGVHHASAFILQAFSFGDNLDDGQAIGACSPNESKLACWNQVQYPSAAAQLELRNEVIQNAHPKLILWWSFQGTFGDAMGDTYSIYPTGASAAAHWAGLTAAINAPAPAGSVDATPAPRPVAHVATVHRPAKKKSRRHIVRKYTARRDTRTARRHSRGSRPRPGTPIAR